MQVQTHTDDKIERHEPLTRHVEDVVKEVLSRYSKQITRVVVHLSDTNDYKSSNGDHRCQMEARMEGHPPIVASDHGTSLHQAIRGAAEKLKRSIDNALGRINGRARNHKGDIEVVEVAPTVNE